MDYFQVRMNNGRWGNQLFQLATAIGLAKKYNAAVKVPENWVGWHIFKLPSIVKPELLQPDAVTDLDALPTEEQINNAKVIELLGYYQYQNALDLYSLKDLATWFVLKYRWLEKFQQPDYQYACCHVRRGDYVFKTNLYCCITDESYRQAVEHNSIKEGITNVVWLTEENPQIDDECEQLSIGFLPDFMKMIWAEHLYRANSTFSWWSSVFNTLYNNGKTFSPVVGDLVGWQDVSFIDGNAPKMASSVHHPSTQLTDLYLKDNL